MIEAHRRAIGSIFKGFSGKCLVMMMHETCGEKTVVVIREKPSENENNELQFILNSKPDAKRMVLGIFHEPVRIMMMMTMMAI